ncbi:MAG: amidohydrolase family protein [Balneolaceae bacterium]|nr:amidohydrolase family protein [Balneolaceae bacterium]
MDTIKKIALVLIFCSFTAVGVSQPTGSVLIKDGTVLTVTNGTIENGDVLIEDGIITQIGEDVSAPGGADVIDASGKYVMPGIIDPHSHIAGVDINEASNPVTAEVKMGNSIDPNDISIYRALAGGVSSIHLLHGSANVIGGESETLKLRYGQGQEGLKFEDAPRTIKFALGENPTRVHGQGSGIQPRTRMGVEQVIRRTFDAALDYRRNREAYLEAKENYNGQGAPPRPVAKNLRMETIADIIEGDILVHCHSYRADEILMLMRVFDDYGVENYTFTHANEAFKVAPELKEHGAYASVFSDWWAYKFEVYYSTAYNASILNANGVVTSINSDSGELIRHLNHEAAKTIRYGNTSKADALKMITLNPAIQLGINDKVGSLEEGKHGDVSIWSKHPLSIYSINQMTFVDGVKYFDREEDADDMRIDINPGESWEQPTVRNTSEHGCMHDTFYLFSETAGE